MLSHYSRVQLFATPWTVACPSHGSLSMILQPRILGRAAMSFSRGSSPSRDQTESLMFPELAGGFFTISAAWEAHKGMMNTQCRKVVTLERVEKRI